ncbi:N-acetylaspartate synthetase-like [Corythoichthys intestinalis]|uniref:N-acetylaspartate synthetase-like n=1 Tax=Corythoichthys intestinalis TaxID=161448 RepID=UPI0025A551DD|nr:N-acetylaspartate synthetase-like [Corythoichthys intestinalis]XP_057698416.1 N-acetylaspartate synthetase-like [Corythoichthys intestinalis]
MEEKILDNVATQLQNGRNTKSSTLVIREFEPEDQVHVQRIFAEGMMEMIFDTAFRGLRRHPESILLYFTMAAASFVFTMCWWVIALLPAVVLCCRYLCSSRVIRGYLEEAMNKDMGHIEEFYINSTDSHLWVAVLDGQVVGVVAVVGQKGGGFAELKRMSVDRRCRRCGVGMALGSKVLEFAKTQGYSTVVLGTTAYSPAAHKLYQRLGFQCSGVTNGYVSDGATPSLLERIFYRVRHHHYRLEVKNTPLNRH